MFEHLEWPRLSSQDWKVLYLVVTNRRSSLFGTLAKAFFRKVSERSRRPPRVFS